MNSLGVPALTSPHAVPLPGSAKAVPGADGIITWEAETIVPRGYTGKALPVQSSFVRAAFEFIENGKFADLSKRELRWFLDDALFAKGNGLKTTRMRVTAGNNNSHFIRVQITDGRAILFEKSAEIPVVNPRLRIQPPSFDGLIARGAHELRAIPYFFNAKSVDEITFGWNVNGQAASGIGVDEPFKLAFSIPADIASGTPLVISVFAANKNDQTERASKELRFSVK